ncbi:PASTA domain-containing protein [candidate division KSB1 bacterium]|nr:PASTA domain-containing protein [candidate division KSB1 bacterium]
MQREKLLIISRNVALGVFVFVALFITTDKLVMPMYTRHWQAIVVPDVTYMSQAAAQKILTQNGLKPLKGVEKYDETYPPGFVLFQNPEAGSLVKKGRRVYLTVGKGKMVFEMPNLVGKNERDVMFILDENQLKLGKIDRKMDHYYPENVVIDQSIREGNNVATGQIIDIVVSLGIQPLNYIVPDVVGKSLEEAEEIVYKAGLVLGRKEYQITQKLLPNTILSQNMRPGTSVSRGDSIHVVISTLTNTEEEQ